ncbi:MAG: HIT family protein [Patescibacteria group bacterium]|nr:HIT family protein [Patescibacteria group bacterium]
MNDCLFCKIVSGEIPCHKVYEDKNFLAFLDINPANLGHTLIIPKKHSKNILEMDDELSKEMIIIIKKISKKIKTSLKSDGINILMNNEAGAGQIIFHTHVHIIPRFLDDGLKHWPSKKITNIELEKIRNKLF